MSSHFKKDGRSLGSASVAIFGVTFLGVAGGSAPIFAQSAPAQSASTNSPDVVIVTAQKRAEDVQTVPASVTVLSGETLSEQQLTRIEDIAALVPGMSYEHFGAGQNIITLRGVTSGPEQLSNSVGVYLDEIPFGSSNADNNGGYQTGDFDTFDMKRVEVLQGPQGTLYGANAIGGLIKYVTNAPDPQAFDSIVNVGGVYTQDGGAGYSVKAMVNVPLSSDAALRITGFTRRDPGFIDDNGMFPRSDVNTNTFYGGRISLLWTPTDKLSIRLTAFSQSIASDGTSVVDLNPTTLKPLYGSLDQQRLVPEPYNSHYTVGSGTVSYDMDWATITSTSSYSVFKYIQPGDFTGDFGSYSSFYGLPGNEFAANGVQNSRLERTTEELRLASPAGSRLEWQIGGYYDLETAYFDFNVVPYTLVPQRAALAGQGPLTTLNPSNYRDLAAFGDVDYHFTSAVDMTLGARESFNHQTFSSDESSIAEPGVVSPSAGTSADNAFTFLASPRWNVSSDTMVYARVAKGFRAGGPNALPPGTSTAVPETYLPDSLISYEAGVKTQWPELAHLTVDMAGYHIIWTNIQMETVVDGLGAAVNASKALIDGAQFAANIEPFRGFDVALDLGYQHARLAADAPIIGGVAGDPLPAVPQFNGALQADYRWAVTDAMNASVGATFRYIDAEESDFLLAGDQYLIPATRMLDLRAALDFGHSSVSLVAKNVTNEVGYSTIAPGPDGVYGYRMPPRTIGVYFQQEIK